MERPFVERDCSGLLKICLAIGNVHSFFSLDDGEVAVPVDIWIYPPFEEKILEEDQNTRIVRRKAITRGSLIAFLIIIPCLKQGYII